MIIEHRMRPLFGLETLNLPTGIYAPAGSFNRGQMSAAAAPECIDLAIEWFPFLR